MSEPIIRPSSEELLKFLVEKLSNKYIIACVGSPLRSDDRAGLEICEQLAKKGVRDSRLIKCEYGLETCIDKIISSKPRGIIMIDAGYAEGVPPGTIILSSIRNIKEPFALATTHNVPIRLLLKLLEKETPAKDFYVVAIIAEKLDIGMKLSERVRKAVESLAEVIQIALEKSMSNKINH
ncbi:MAG: hydrogenase maturation protease [Desulfurococcales archaeon]|nr:hydrogenase maturation protease [Desulfurococcales archaeon]